VVEHAGGSSLASTLHLRPNDLLHWRAIEWACAEGLSKCSLGGHSLFLRKFRGEVVPTIRYRLDLSLFRRHIIRDWTAERVEEIRPFVPPRVVGLGRFLRSHINNLRSHAGGRSA
jgi:Acetyltransferase (GNAT) domain